MLGQWGVAPSDTPARIGGVTTGDRIDMATLTKLMA